MKIYQFQSFIQHSIDTVHMASNKKLKKRIKGIIDTHKIITR